MKNIIQIGRITLLCVFALISNASFAQARQLQGLDLAYFYYDKSGLPVPWEQLAKHYSEYRTANNEFDRREQLALLQPIMEQDMEAILDQGSFLIRTNTTVQDYDFDNEVFPLGFSSGIFFRFDLHIEGARFAVTFLNHEHFNNWELPPEEARAIAEALQSQRDVRVEMEVVPMAAREDRLNSSRQRIVETNVKSLKLINQNNGNVLGVITPTQGLVTQAPEPEQPPSTVIDYDAALEYANELISDRVDSAADCIRKYGYTECQRRYK